MPILGRADNRGNYEGIYDNQGPSRYCSACIFLVIFIFINSSLSSVGPLELGLKSDDITSAVDTSRTYTSGLYWIWPFHSFLKFPSTQVTITFSDFKTLNPDAPPISTRTGEDKNDPDSGGQPITIYASIQYKLPQDDRLGKIYSSLGNSYQERYTLIARNTISNVAQTFNPTEFWTKRTEIAEAMFDQLQYQLARQGYISVTQLQLLRIDFPEKYEAMITTIQLQVQQKSIKEYQQRVVATLRNLDVMQAEVSAQTSIIDSNANRRAKMIINKASADGYVLQQAAKANATKVIVDALHLTPEQTVQYLKIQAIKNHPSRNSVLGTGDVFANDT